MSFSILLVVVFLHFTLLFNLNTTYLHRREGTRRCSICLNKPVIRLLLASLPMLFQMLLLHDKLQLQSCLLSFLVQALLKMDCQGLVARLVLDFVLLTTAVEVASRWRELAEKLARVSRQQMEAYEAPHRDKNGLLDNEVPTTVLFKHFPP